jgi:hypothetical protein
MTVRLIVPMTLLVAVLIAGCQTAPPTPIDGLAAETGMQRLEVSELDAIYRKPGVSFARYDKLLLRPVEISLRKSWDPRVPGERFPVSDQDLERIKKDFAATFMDVFERELNVDGGYELVAAPGPGVLEMRVEVTDLFIPAPDLSRYSTVRTRSFTRDGSEMTLIAELRDSLSGEVLSRAYDERRVSKPNRFELANEITNRADARRVFKTWVEQLRVALDRSAVKSG